MKGTGLSSGGRLARAVCGSKHVVGARAGGAGVGRGGALAGAGADGRGRQRGAAPAGEHPRDPRLYNERQRRRAQVRGVRAASVCPWAGACGAARRPRGRGSAAPLRAQPCGAGGAR